MKKIFIVATLLLISTNYGCMTAAEHHSTLPSTQEQEMTVGIVQKEIRVGMSQADVATALGSPNIVTRDSNGKETWIYDKIASEVSYSQSASGTGLIINLFGGTYREAGASSSTQKTLTVVIKFNDKNLVESFSYHASKF